MRFIIKKLLLILLLTFPSISFAATTYYIDCAGDNSNNGLTTGTAWADTTNIQGVNFLQPDDVVNIKTGCTFSGATSSHVIIRSHGKVGHPIIIQTYGGGVDPIFDGSVAASSVPSWSGWTLYDAPSNTWVSNVNIPWTPNTVIIDGTSSLRRIAYGTNAGINNQSLTFVKAYRQSFGISDINQPIYVHLIDGSDPNGHTIRFGRYQGEDGAGLGGHDRGLFCIFDDKNTKYIDVNHIQVMGSNRFNFTSGAPYINFKNCTSFAASRENFYLVKNAVQNSTGAKYNTIQNSTSTYSNTNFGQNVTIESSYVDIIDSTVAYGWMAGIDWLDYNADTDASHGRCIRCIAHDNGRRAIDQDFNGFDPPGIYIDGGHDIQIIDSVIYMSDSLFDLSTANALFLLSIQTEHPDTKPSYNVDIINSLIYGSNFTNVLMGNAINCSGTACDVCWNNRLIGSTVSTLGSGGAVNVGRYRAAGPGVTIVNNVIGQNNSNKKPLTAGDISLTIIENMDYNVYINNTGTHTTGVLVDNTAVGVSDLSLDQWQALRSYDSHSLFLDPIYVGSGTSGGIDQTYHLSSVASGQGSNSPGLGLAFPNYLGIQYSWTSIGTVRTDAVIDDITAPASGYHYLSTFKSSTFLPRAEGSGTDYY